MTLQELTNVATILGAMALVASVGLLYHELRVNNKLARAANTQALVELSSPFNLSLIQDRKMAEFCVCGAEQLDKMDDVDRYRYKCLLTWWLVYHENIYYQWRQGLLDEHSYRPWAADLELFIRRQNLAAHWDVMHALFQEEFAGHVSRRIAELSQGI